MGPVNRPLDLEWLEDFLALAESGNFSRAAQARAIAQPAFSRHIRSLEEWAGLALVDRTTHPVALTAAGQALQPLLAEVVQRLVQARTRAHEAQEASDRRLQLAATHVLSMTYFPLWLQKLESRLDIGAIQMVSDSFQACEDLMLQRRVQCLLCHGHPALKTRLAEPDFIHVAVDQDLLLPVAAPLPSGRPAFEIESAADRPLPMLCYSQESGLGQIMRAALPQALAETRFVPGFTSHHAVLLKTMALEGRGLAWLPRSLIAPELAQGTLVPAGGEAWQIPVDIRLYRQQGPLSTAAEALWRLVQPQ
ncbi:LysR family transcriptional regulator [Ramlibacter sp. 2FC]|uniref:LysR family transcriptional regulator n=1 Tax=Ramlibacter sp. 2FC TaxID=2502188 RepID=UPI0010F99A7E|nr:LysR family transcriptional regulator [Ramlibacter sp. 2FC]